MTKPTYALNVMLIRMAKGALKAWEVWLRDANDASDPIELPPPSGQMRAAVLGLHRDRESGANPGGRCGE